MTKTNYMIQMRDLEAADMLQKLAREDLRSYGNQVAYLIRQEVERRSFKSALHFSTVSEDLQALDNYRKETNEHLWN